MTRKDPETCTHDTVELGPRPDRETCVDCGSSWPPGTVTGPREENARLDALVKERLARIEREQTRDRETEVKRRVDAELAKRESAARTESQARK